MPLDPHAAPAQGLEPAELPGEDRAASVTHRGPVEEIADAWHTLDVALREHGLESHGLHRQVHVDDGGEDCVVELQRPVRAVGARTVTAMTAWALARLSRGRFTLGLGTPVKGHIEDPQRSCPTRRRGSVRPPRS